MGQRIKKMLTSEKGSITVLVVAAMLFMIVILVLSFMSVSNKKSAQMSNIKQIEAEYGAEEDIGEVYKETIEIIEIGKIRLTPSTTEWTNEDVIVTVEYEKQLTENRRAGIGSANVPNATSLTVTENATVYAEASTKEGQKRKASLEIKNIDKVKPTAVIRINGGSYVMPTKGDKAIIKTRVSASDLGGSELKDLKYAWSQSKDVEPTTWQTFADGETLTKNDCTIGTYYLWLNITDHAGNRSDTRVSNAFIVRDSSNAMDNITFKIEPDGWTKDDVKVTVIYGDNLTENRKAGPEGEELKPNATIVTMTKNGKVVAEAEDPAGNKVIASIDIDKIDKVAPVIKTVTNPSNGNWTNQDVTVTLVAEDNLSGIKEFQWFENGEWTKRELVTSGNTGTITYTVDRDTTIRFRVIDNAGNISEEKTTVLKIDKTAPTHTSVEIKNITTTGYDVYIYGVTDGAGSGVNRVQFPTWTNENWQDDIQSNWETNASATGVKQADGTTWVYRVNVTDHKNEYGGYITDVYTYDNIGNKKCEASERVQVPGVVITFNANGGTVTEVTRTKGYASQIGTLPTPTRAGYTFTGWFTAPTGGTKITDATTVPANNVTYYAQWTRNTYTISYNLNGGTITGNPTSYNVETETITLPTPTKTGYTFTGWTGSNGTTPQTTVTIPKGSTGNKTYTANWTATNYTITYNLNGGTITGNPGNYNIESNEITLPTPTKTGYTFAGWTGSNGTTPQTTVKIPKGQTGNKTYTANWTANTYTLSYNANGGTGTMATDTVTFDQNYTTKANTFTRTGYTFKGWNEKADGTGTDWTSWIGKPWKWSYTRNVTLYAQWTRDTYTVTYNLNGGTANGPTSYNVETETITLPTPTKNGYTFTGWTGSNGTTPQKTVTITKGSTGNKTYTANWTATNYTISYNLNGGSISGQPTSYNIESNDITLPTPTKTGYTFTGWTGSNGTTPQTTVTIPKGSTENRNYTANWSINNYYIDLNMNVDGTGYGSGYNSRVTVGFKVGGVDKGYIQDYYAQHPYGTSWEIYGLKLDGEAVAYTASGTLGAGNADVRVNLNTVNFVANNSSYGTVSVANRLVVKGTNYTASGATVTLAGGRTITATKTDATGYTTTFTGWTPTSGTVNAATTVTANFTRTANKYTIAYNANGGTGTMATDTVTFDQNYTTKANTFTRTGYTFKGWNEKADGTGTDWTSWIGKPWKWSYTRNVTLYAQWVDSTAPTIEAYAGTMMFTDPSFASGNNSIRVYNNSANGTVTHTRKAMSDNPAGSGYGIEIKTTGTASPGHGGFYFGHSTAANKEYIARIIAKIPTGYEIEWASNAYGTGGSITALTSKAGTGKWQEYLFKVKCGSTGSFSTTNFFYVKGGSTATASAPVVWQVGYATIFDTTAWGTSNYIIYTGADAGSGVVGYGVNQSDTTEPTYTTCTATSKISSISDAKTANGKYYVWVKDAAGNKGKKEVSVNYVDRAAPTFTKVEVKNLSTTGYDVYVYGVTDGTGSGVNRVQFPTWTDANSQDDIQSNWQTNASATGVKQADGTTWVYRVNVTDHKNEYGVYNTHIYLFDNLGNYKSTTAPKQTVPGVTITFNANGGTVTEGTRTKGYASQMGTLPTPTRTGYTFNGWYTATTGGTKIEASTQVPASNVTYYAHWTVNSYTVTYNYAENGGKSATKTSASVNYGSAIDLTPTAAKDGYTFVGWNTNKDATSKLDSLNIGAGNVTLYAIYSKTITGTFNYFDGTKAANKQVSQTVYNKTTQATIKAPTLENASKDSTTYTARGWSTSNAADATVNVNSGANVTLSSSATYYASYQATITATFYYHTGDNWTTTQSSATASATRFMNYAGTYKQSNIAVPSAVSSSAGYVSTTYKGVSNAKSSATLVTPSTASTAYYAVYNVEITYYYYNGSSHTSSTGIRTSTTNGSAYGASVNTEPKPTAYDGANFKWWSYSPTQISSDYQRTPAGTAEKSLYAVYEKSVTATFYYHTGDNGVNTQASTTASGTKNYVSKSGGVNTYNGNISIPAAVTGSSTYLTTAYKGVANAVNSSTSVTPTTANTKYYAFYECSLTYYFYNGSAHTSSSTTRRARSNGTNYVCTVDSVPTPSAYDGAAFKWWSYDANQAGSDYKREPNATGVQTLYAMYQKSITATFNYYNGTAAATATASATRSYISKSGGVNTIQANIGIPAAVSGSKGVESTTYSHVSTSKTGSATTPNTATATYYAVYKKTVTATKYVYNNTSSTATGTAYAYYDGSKANASINLGTTTPPSGYTARHWSTSNAANAGASVALNGNASIMNNTTYYMSYSYSVTLTYNGNGATSGVPAAQSGTAYMNYAGTKTGAAITLSTTKPTRTNYTFSGWYTATSGGTKLGTSHTITGNTTIYAQWSGNVYTVTLNTQSATSAGSTAVYEKYATGIYKESTCTNQMTASANAITKPSRSYTLTYNANGGSVTPASTTASYTFGGYYTATGGSGDQLINANGNITTAFSTTKYSANATLYAKWTANATTLATPTREGYTFKGWFTAASGGTQITSSTVINENQTIYAQWNEVPFSTNYGRIEIVWLNENNTVRDTPNPPVLTSNGESMTPVTWTEVKNSAGSITSWTEDATAKSSWYSYTAGSGTNDNVSSKWANAKTKNGSYFVWIPRFAYRIKYYASETSNDVSGYCDGFGIRQPSGTVRYTLDTGLQTVDYNGFKYIVHPAFETNLDMGGWSSDLKGFWFAKYEMSGSGSITSSTNTLKSVPNVSNLIHPSAGEQYTYSRNANYGYAGKAETISSGGTNYTHTSYMNSHLMKNSEWGAVAYLAHSKYGRNGHEIDINNSSSYITGNGGGSPNATSVSGTANAYNTVKGARASTTGNVYGIYDMSGGAWETAAVLDKLGKTDIMNHSSFGQYLTREAKDSSGNYISTKYITKYQNGNSSGETNIVIYGVGKIGAISKEAHKGGEYGATSTQIYKNWFNDNAGVVSNGYPFAIRGGAHDNKSDTGLFACGGSYGFTDNTAFRTVLCP